MEQSVVELGPVIEALVTLLTGVLVALAVFAVNWVRQKIGLDKMTKDDMVREYLDTAIRSGISYAVNALMDGRTTISTRSEFVAIVAQYLSDSVPDALVHFGLTSERVEALIEARIGQHLPDGVTALVKEVQANEPSS